MRCPFRLRGLPQAGNSKCSSGAAWILMPTIYTASGTVRITPEMPDRCPGLQRFSYCSLRPLGSRLMPAPCANYDRQII
jgi:hypothetical protein